MRKNLSKLIDVKSITTLILVCIFCYLSIADKITGEQFLVIFTTVIAFYFGTQYQKGKDE